MAKCPLCNHDPDGSELVAAELMRMQSDRADEFRSQLAAVTLRLLAQRKRLRELERLRAPEQLEALLEIAEQAVALNKLVTDYNNDPANARVIQAPRFRIWERRLDHICLQLAEVLRGTRVDNSSG